MQAAVYKEVDEVYVTIFAKHEALIKLLQRYGFEERGKKGDELVLVRPIKQRSNDVLRITLLSIQRNENSYWQ